MTEVQNIFSSKYQASEPITMRMEGNLLCAIEGSSSSQATSMYLWITRMAALVYPQLEVSIQRHLISESLACALSTVIKQGLSSCAPQDWNSQLYFGLYPRSTSPETFCAHLPEPCQGPLRAGQPHPTPLPSLVRPGQAQSETDSLRTSVRLPQETSGSPSHVTSTPLGVLACIVLRYCPKVWQTLVGSQKNAGAFLGLGVCWCLAHWQEEKKPEQSGHCVVFLYFPVSALIANTTLLICNYLLWNAFVVFVICTFVSLLHVSYFNSCFPSMPVDTCKPNSHWY